MLFQGYSGLWCDLRSLGADIERRQSSRGQSYTYDLRHQAAPSCELSSTFLLTVSMTLPSMTAGGRREARGNAASSASS